MVVVFGSDAFFSFPLNKNSQNIIAVWPINLHSFKINKKQVLGQVNAWWCSGAWRIGYTTTIFMYDPVFIKAAHPAKDKVAVFTCT